MVPLIGTCDATHQAEAVAVLSFSLTPEEVATMAAWVGDSAVPALVDDIAAAQP